MDLISLIVLIATLAMVGFAIYQTMAKPVPDCKHGCFRGKCLRCNMPDTTDFPMLSGDSVCKNDMDCQMCQDVHSTEEEASGTKMPASRRLMNERIQHINDEIDRRNRSILPPPEQKDPILLK